MVNLLSVSIMSLSQFLSLRKGMSEAEVTSEDREHAKRIVYSLVYGAGGYIIVCFNREDN